MENKRSKIKLKILDLCHGIKFKILKVARIGVLHLEIESCSSTAPTVVYWKNNGRILRGAFLVYTLLRVRDGPASGKCY